MAEALLSVVVATHDRPHALARCLEALASLEDPVDVVVVDSASDPPCTPIVERFTDRIPRLRYCYEAEPGLSRARNRGLGEASCELVAFVDDDAAVASDWARRLAQPFANAGVACAGGSCRPHFEAPRPRWLSERVLQFAGITRIGRTAREATSSAEYPFGANVCFRRTAIDEIGGFREDLGRSARTLLSGEEAAVMDRLRARGWRIWLQPDAVVSHTVTSDRCSSTYYWRRLWWQGITRARTERTPRTAVRLIAAAPLRLVFWLGTRDRIYLYRLAETAGFLCESARLRRSPS
jgi:glucosyl-dolichyl phosphate glucuronosyltransferase